MKKTLGFFKALALVITITLLMTACGGSKTPTKPEEKSPQNTVNEDILKADTVIGSYEGEWQMSPNMKPLASLVLLKENKYEFFISIMGLMEEGTFAVSGKDKITFTPAAPNVPAFEGKYADGVVTASFMVDKDSVPFTFTQVGTPDDVYKLFLGDYATKVMGKMDVTLSLLPGRKYLNTLSKETGTFKIYNGTITLLPDKQGTSPITGTFNIGTKEMKITMSIMEGTPAAEMTYKKKTEEKALTGTIYKGTSSVGMTGSTAVTLVLMDGEKFELQTTKPRGTGTYKITEEGGKIIITLTYTEPAKRPDGSEFKMIGIMKNKDIKAAGNSITIDVVEYTVNMGSGDSIMNLGQVIFELSTGN